MNNNMNKPHTKKNAFLPFKLLLLMSLLRVLVPPCFSWLSADEKVDKNELCVINLALARIGNCFFGVREEKEREREGVGVMGSR